MRIRAVAVVFSFALAWACRPSDSTASLSVMVSPTSVTGAQPVKVTVSAANADGTAGAGSVQVSSNAGTLTTPVALTLDGSGQATTMLTADPVVDMCSTSVEVDASWTPKSSDAIAAHARLTVLTPGFDAGSSTPNALSPIDALCDTDAGLTTVYPDAGPLLPNDVPSDCANGFEVNNPTGHGVYIVTATPTTGSRPITLDVDLATYKVPDRVQITGVDACSNDYLLLSSCELQTANVGDPTGGAGRPPDNTIRQFRLNVPGGTKQLTFDFSGVTSPMYLQVLGLCDFDLTPYANASSWQAVP